MKRVTLDATYNNQTVKKKDGSRWITVDQYEAK